MFRLKTVLMILIGFFSLAVFGEKNITTSITTSTTSSTTVISKTVITEKAPWKPFRVCVLDFTTLDIKGQIRFLDRQHKLIDVPPQSTLNDADRKSMNAVMQGFVRLIDAWDNTKTNTVNREVQIVNNNFDQAKALDLYETTVKGGIRPVILGADYLAAYLGRHNDVFSCINSAEVAAAMQKLRNAPDFPKDFMLRLAKATGATHLIFGTVSDMRVKANSFKGYGIETQTTNFQLDVIIKLVDLASQSTAYSNVYTGHYREQRPISGTQFDYNIFQNLMTSALEQAAEDLYDRCRPGRKNKIRVTPMPYVVSVEPAGELLFQTGTAETFVDGKYAGSGVCSFTVPAGPHTLEIKAAGYKNRVFNLNVNADQTIKVKLEKIK